MKMKLLSGGFRKGSVHGVAPSVMLLAVTATLLNVVPTPAFGASTSLKQSTEVTLTLGASAGHVDDVVDVDVSVASESEGPALVVFRVSYDETALEYVDVNEGAAATAAEKIVTGNLRSDGDLGIAVWGLNFNAIPDGVLMTLSFRILAGTEGEYLSLTGSKASAASAEDTPQRLEIAVVPGQIRIGDPCVAPDAPTNIDASDGTYDEYIRVQWDAVSGARRVPRLSRPQQRYQRRRSVDGLADGDVLRRYVGSPGDRWWRLRLSRGSVLLHLLLLLGQGRERGWLSKRVQRFGQGASRRRQSSCRGLARPPARTGAIRRCCRECCACSHAFCGR